MFGNQHIEWRLLPKYSNPSQTLPLESRVSLSLFRSPLPNCEPRRIQPMQLIHSDEPASERCDSPEKPEDSNSVSDSLDSVTDDRAALDVTGKNLEFPEAENVEHSAESLYVYKNIYSLIPKSVSRLERLRTLKFFGNEINLFAPEVGNLTALECLQMKISSPGIGGLPLHTLQGLKELELSKGPPRPSAFPILTEISGLRCLTKLSICHFSIRLVFVPLSFNFSELYFFNTIVVLDYK